MMIFRRIALSILGLVVAAEVWGYALFSGRADLARGGEALMAAVGDAEHPLCEVAGWLLTRDVATVQRAYGWFSQALRNNAGLAQAYLLRGQAACLLGDYAAAIADLGQFTRLQPENPLGWLELGFALEASGSAEGAAVVWRRAGLNAESFLSEAGRLRVTNDWQQALRYYRMAQAMGAQAQGVIALVNFEILRTSDFEAAFNQLLQAVQVDIGWVDVEAKFMARLRLGEALLQRGKYDEGQQMLLLAVAVGEQGGIARHWLSEAYRLLAASAHAQKNLDQAEVWVTHALVLNPNSAWAYIERGKLTFHRTRATWESQTYFLHGLDLSNYSPIMARNLLIFWQEEQNFDALSYLCSVLAQHNALSDDLQEFCSH